MALDITPQTKLSDWHEAWIKQILDQDLSEGYLYDFKSDLSVKDQSLSKSISSFANTQGGFIIFGIKDTKAASGWDRLHGITSASEFSKNLSDHLANGKVVPNIFFEDPNVIEVNHEDKKFNVFIVKIDDSPFKPHAVVGNDGQLKFWVRNNQTAVAMTYPTLIKTIEDSSQLRNWLAALFLDTEYVDTFARKMIIVEADRESAIPVVRVNSFINSDQSSQIISIIPNDVQLVSMIWSLREKIDIINSFRDMMIQRRALPLTNARSENKKDNDYIASVVPDILATTLKVRNHLVEKYPKIREWLSVVQK